MLKQLRHFHPKLPLSTVTEPDHCITLNPVVQHNLKQNAQQTTIVKRAWEEMVELGAEVSRLQLQVMLYAPVCFAASRPI